jgi:hypothetical protein
VTSPSSASQALTCVSFAQPSYSLLSLLGFSPIWFSSLTSLVAPIIQFLHDAVDFTREEKRNGFASGFQFSLVHWCGPKPVPQLFFSPHLS